MGFFLVIGFFEMNKYFDIELNIEDEKTFTRTPVLKHNLDIVV